jgi:hypothetical protein
VFSQGPLSVSPRGIRFQAVIGGLMPGPTKKIEIDAGSPWVASLGSGPENMIGLSKANGAGKDVLQLNLTEWWVERQKPGKYEQTISIRPETGNAGPAQVVQVSVELAAASPTPKFSYIAGPHGCSDVPGLPAPAICTVPGERPPGDFQPPEPGKSYTDPNFGARITVLTKTPFVHGYSSPSAISAANRYVLVGTEADWGSQVIDLQSGSRVADQQGIPKEGVIWDSQDENVGYVVGPPKQEATIYRFDARSHASKKIADLSS